MASLEVRVCCSAAEQALKADVLVVSTLGDARRQGRQRNPTQIAE